jgi:CHASE3 domain sensor protein|tara:strand:+ start:903 stop:1166 length:264 start_codon:yes stop_codon:yes gene_type:complete
MFKKVINLFFLLLFFIFTILTITFYFSDENIRKTNKFRSLYSINLNKMINNLPLLKNDTSDIIQYKNDVEIYKKKKKNYIFWDLLEK